MPASNKCSGCMNVFDCDAHFPMHCKCGRYTICEQCSIHSVKLWRPYCCPTAPLERDATFSKFANERNILKAVIAGQKQKLEMAEKLNKEKDAKIAKLEENQGNSCYNNDGVRCMQVWCRDCGIFHDEKEFSICRTCTKEQTKIDILNCDALSEAKLRYFAVCQRCIKYYHEGHELVDYFPILASINHQTQVMATSIIQSKLDKTSEEIREKMENMLKSLEEAKKVANEMTENMRIAKSSRNQKVLSDLIMDCFVKIRFDTEETTLQLKELPELHFIGNHLEELKEKHKKMEMEELKNANSTEGVGRFEAGTDAPKCSENDGRKQAKLQVTPTVGLLNMLQNSEELMDTEEFHRRCMNHFKNEEKQEPETPKQIEAKKAFTEFLMRLPKEQCRATFDTVTNTRTFQLGKFGVNSLSHQFDNFTLASQFNLPSTSAATQCNDKDSEDGSGSEASFEKI